MDTKSLYKIPENNLIIISIGDKFKRDVKKNKPIIIAISDKFKQGVKKNNPVIIAIGDKFKQGVILIKNNTILIAIGDKFKRDRDKIKGGMKENNLQAWELSKVKTSETRGVRGACPPGMFPPTTFKSMQSGGI